SLAWALRPAPPHGGPDSPVGQRPAPCRCPGPGAPRPRAGEGRRLASPTPLPSGAATSAQTGGGAAPMVGQPAKRVRGSAGGVLQVPVLVILDMNGVLLLRPRGGKEA
ncbi:unnamed protein product, partial [Prorocentrum cordatum]